MIGKFYSNPVGETLNEIIDFAWWIELKMKEKN